jgi:hypothetical protein
MDRNTDKFSVRHGDKHGDADKYGYIYRNGHTHSHTHGYGYVYADPDSYGDSFGKPHSVTDRNCHRVPDSHFYRVAGLQPDRDADRHAADHDRYAYSD